MKSGHRASMAGYYEDVSQRSVPSPPPVSLGVTCTVAEATRLLPIVEKEICLVEKEIAKVDYDKFSLLVHGVSQLEFLHHIGEGVTLNVSEKSDSPKVLEYELLLKISKIIRSKRFE